MKYTVLVVEDEYEQRRAVIERVNWEAAGFEVVGEAENGRDALELAESVQGTTALNMQGKRLTTI